ncbi:31881_t:CDS:1, partial [Gigaspora margarita]
LYKLLKELELIKNSYNLITQTYNDYKLLKKQGLIANSNRKIEESDIWPEEIEEKYLKANENAPEDKIQFKKKFV